MMTEQTKSYPVPPNSVYVWRGFMAPYPQTYEKFAGFLGSVFVPACALLQPPVGLRAYLPTMVPQLQKPAAVPDQTALMFWAKPQAHDLANEAIAVRIYQNLHGDAYDMVRSHLPEIPVALPQSASEFTAEQPCYLFENEADWMVGDVCHVVGARPADRTPEAFLASVFNWAEGFKSGALKGIDGALVCAGNDYAVAWVHTHEYTENFKNILDDFSALLQPQLNILPRAMALNAGLWNNWPGIDLTLPENTSLNIQFERNQNTSPEK
jgi:hypothetical protein